MDWEAEAIETKKKEKEALISHFQQWVDRMASELGDSDEEIKEVIFNFLDSELPDFLKIRLSCKEEYKMEPMIDQVDWIKCKDTISCTKCEEFFYWYDENLLCFGGGYLFCERCVLEIICKIMGKGFLPMIMEKVYLSGRFPEKDTHPALDWK